MINEGTVKYDKFGQFCLGYCMGMVTIFHFVKYSLFNVTPHHTFGVTLRTSFGCTPDVA